MGLAPSYTVGRRSLWASILRIAFLAAPTGFFLLLLWNPHLDTRVQAPELHFAVVTFTAAGGAVLAALMLVVAERLQERRVFFLALAFGAMAGFYFIHGFLTPGVIFKQTSNGIHWAPLVGFCLSAVFLALSTERARPSGDSWVLRHRRIVGLALVVMWAGFLALSISHPRFLEGQAATAAVYVKSWRGFDPHAGHVKSSDDFAADLVAQLRGERDPQSDETDEGVSAYGEPTGRPWIAGMLSLGAVALMSTATVRYARRYRLSQLASHVAMVWGGILLLQSLLGFFFSSVWRVSWWEYHALSLLGVITITYGLILDYRGAGLGQALTALLADGTVAALERSYSEVLTGLTAAVEARDPYTGGHSEKVAGLAAQIAERLGLSPEGVRLLYQAGLLHDVGKVAIPDAILNKNGRLSPEEFDLVKGHPARSEDIVARIPSLRPTRWAIRWHHERLDGSGYPDGLTRDQIPLEARILAIADVFDAMTSGRAYRHALAQADVLAWMDERAGVQFDQRCLECLREVVGQTAESYAGQPARLVTVREGH